LILVTRAEKSFCPAASIACWPRRGLHRKRSNCG
jgi:hypothetical protein